MTGPSGIPHLLKLNMGGPHRPTKYLATQLAAPLSDVVGMGLAIPIEINRPATLIAPAIICLDQGD